LGRRALDALSDPRDTNLAYFQHCVEISFAPWVAADFHFVKRIAKSIHGEIRQVLTKEGAGVVAKVVPTEAVERSRKRERNERQIWLCSSEEIPIVEDLWNELAVLTYLQLSHEQSKYVIRLHGLFQDVDSTYLVTEYCDGGELFERVAYGDPITEGEKKRYVCQLLQAVQHLHRHNVGHRDVSLENVLLRRGECVLIDFGQAVRLRAVDGTVLRYFTEAGKRMYRAPEMYVPRERPIQVICPMDGAPGGIAQVAYNRCRCEVVLPPDAAPGKPCAAEPYGYTVGPSDVFACGVCAFALIVGKPPWVMARDTDPTFLFIRRQGIPMLLQQWRGGGRGIPTTPPDDETAMLAEMLCVDPRKRPSVDTWLDGPYLASVRPTRNRRHTA
jgi:serine/threonine protein kinase